MKKNNYLEELKNAVASAFEGSDTKESVDALVNINAAIKGLEDERKTLMDKQRELISAYKDAVMNPGISAKADPEPTQLEKKVETLDLADFVQKQLSKK